VFFTRPISGALMGIAIAFVLYNLWAARKKQREARAGATS
jgi:TctA family transporter